MCGYPCAADVRETQWGVALGGGAWGSPDLIGCVNLQSGREQTQPQPCFSLPYTLHTVCFHLRPVGGAGTKSRAITRPTIVSVCRMKVCVFDLCADKDTPAGADCGGHRCGAPAQPPGESRPPAP